jgi:hypothetical protein
VVCPGPAFAANPPVNTVAPTLSGTAQDGLVLTVAKGTWTGMATITYAYQWQVSTDGGASWTNINAATATTYTPPAGSAGEQVRALVTATNGDGSAQAATAASAPILANPDTAPPADTLTLAGKPQQVVYGGRVTVTGTLSNQKVGENVEVLAEPCGQSAATRVTTVQTTTGGAFTALVQPLMNTVYTVKVKSTTSPTLAVTVRPRLRLRKLAPHRYSLRVFAAASFAGKYATFQRYNGALGRWVKVKRVLLRSNATGVAPTVISSASFRSAIRPRLKVRVVLPQLQVGSCYQPGRSNVILS